VEMGVPLGIGVGENMNRENHWDAIVIGGGPAGCAAAIHLANRGHSVLLLERKPGPTPKLCGEFLSMEASGYLERLGVLDRVTCAGAQPITALRLIAKSGAGVHGALPRTALGISRQSLDETLLNRARQLGTECRYGSCVDKIEGSLASGFRVRIGTSSEAARIVFGAYGKRSQLDKHLGRSPHPSPFVAFKAHFRGAHEAHTIEVFGFDSGYIGFAPVEDGLVNACLIAHRRILDRAGGRADDLFKLAAGQNHALGDRLADLMRCGNLIGSSEISFRVKPKFENDVCMIGDTAGMIAPLCGDGMSMAMRAAEIAVSCASRFIADEVSVTKFKSSYIGAWNREFRLRMLIGRAAQAAAFSPAISNVMVCLMRSMPSVKEILIRLTRGDEARAPNSITIDQRMSKPCMAVASTAIADNSNLGHSSSSEFELKSAPTEFRPD
jgi:menaquinone-9 beta-reductase